MTIKKIKAFSLLEAAMAIAIFGLAISIVIPIMQTITIAKKHRINEEKFYQIKIAMEIYLLKHGYLPLPENENGKSIETYKGNVPYIELGLSKKAIYDANNKLFTYAVNKNLTKKEEKTHIPITHPLSTVLPNNCVTFCRIYKQNGKGEVEKYDDIDFDKNLKIFDKNGNVLLENDHIYIMYPLKRFANTLEYRAWKARSLKEKNLSQKNYNLIAWILISHGKKTKNDSIDKFNNLNQEYNFYIEGTDGKIFNDQLFYQTRFDMAAQIGFPCTLEPVYDPSMNEAEQMVRN